MQEPSTQDFRCTLLLALQYRPFFC